MSSSDLRAIAERARVALVEYDREEEEAQRRGHFQVADETEAAAHEAGEVLAMVACVAGMALDASFMGSLARWPDWDPLDGGRGRFASHDYFHGLSGALTNAPEDVLDLAANHPLPAVRMALARALDAGRPGHRVLLLRLVEDSQFCVFHAARASLGRERSGGADAVAWHHAVFAETPRLRASEMWAPHQAAFEKLERAFGLETYEYKERDRLLIEAILELPTELALPLLGYRLQEAKMGATPDELVAEISKREGAVLMLPRAIATLIRNDQYADLHAERQIVRWIEALPRECHHALCLALLERLAESLDDGAWGHQEVIPSLIEKYWPKNADPEPVWKTWQFVRHKPVRYSRNDRLIHALGSSERLSTLKDAVLEHCEQEGIAYPVSSLLDRLVPEMSDQERSALVARWLDSTDEGLRKWALSRHAVALGARESSERCREEARRWLLDSRYRPLVSSEQDLRMFVLPEHRERLLLGELPLTDAHSVMSDIGSLYGGLTPALYSAKDPEADRKRQRERLGAFFDEAAGPPSEAEWAAYRRLQYASLETAWLGALGARPEGAWLPEDLELLHALEQGLVADHEALNTAVLCVYEAIRTKPDPKLLPLLEKAYALSVEDEELGYLSKQIGNLISALGGRLTKNEPAARVELESEWMDQEEDE